MAVLNLNEFKDGVHEVTIKGDVYKIPDQIPMEIFFDLSATQEGIDGMKKGLVALHGLFLIYQPDLKYKEFSNLFTLERYTAVMNFVIAGLGIEETKKLLEEAAEEAQTGKKKPDQAS
ncbi:MAG: hypothetical protein GY853_02330 [PVC group bacterium]|nr:hypothetical protein [PVC group bacterium]